MPISSIILGGHVVTGSLDAHATPEDPEPFVDPEGPLRLLETPPLTHRHRLFVYEREDESRVFEVNLSSGIRVRCTTHAECKNLAAADVAIEKALPTGKGARTEQFAAIVRMLTKHYAPVPESVELTETAGNIEHHVEHTPVEQSEVESSEPAAH
jgi:hypothetical protein